MSEEPGGRTGSYGEADRVSSTETDQDAEPTRTTEEIERDRAGRDQAEG